MSYQLGVDLGTTFTAAAVARGGRVEIASLDYRTAADTQSVLVDAVTEATGASPSRLEVITDETLTDTDSGDVIERNVTTLVVICEVCS